MQETRGDRDGMNMTLESGCRTLHRYKTVQRMLQTAIGIVMTGCAALSSHTTTQTNSAPVATHDTYKLPSPATTGHIKLAWDDPHNASRGMRSYYLYYWQADWDKPKRIDVGLQTTYTLQNLEVGRLYTFAVTVHDGKGKGESAFSNRVSHWLPAHNR